MKVDLFEFCRTRSIKPKSPFINLSDTEERCRVGTFLGSLELPSQLSKPFSAACSCRWRFASNGSGEEVGRASAIGEGEGIGDRLGVTSCDGEGKGVGVVVGVKVAGGDGVSVAVLEGVGLGVAVWRRQLHSSKIAAIAALSLQKSHKGRSEKQLIAGEPEYLQAPRSRNQKRDGMSGQHEISVAREELRARANGALAHLGRFEAPIFHSEKRLS